MTATKTRPSRRNIAALIHVPDGLGLRQTLVAFASHVGGELVDVDDRGLARWSVRAFVGVRLVLVSVYVFTSSHVHSLGMEGSIHKLALGDSSLELNASTDGGGTRASLPLKHVQPIPKVTDQRLLAGRLREFWNETLAQQQ